MHTLLNRKRKHHDRYILDKWQINCEPEMWKKQCEMHQHVAPCMRCRTLLDDARTRPYMGGAAQLDFWGGRKCTEQQKMPMKMMNHFLWWQCSELFSVKVANISFGKQELSSASRSRGHALLFVPSRLGGADKHAMKTTDQLKDSNLKWSTPLRDAPHINTVIEMCRLERCRLE